MDQEEFWSQDETEFHCKFTIITERIVERDTQNMEDQGAISNKKRRGPRKAVWKMLTFECKN